MNSKTCCFTGHRPKSLPWGNNEHSAECIKLKDDLFARIEEAVQNGFTHFIFGAALGIDTYVGEMFVLLRRVYPSIIIEAALPCEKQCVKWRDVDKKRYHDLLKRCDSVTYVSKEYTSSCMMDRNKYVVDHSSLLIAVWNGKPGGTSSTIKYAERKGIKVSII